jgi:hypothetical protein
MGGLYACGHIVAIIFAGSIFRHKNATDGCLNFADVAILLRFQSKPGVTMPNLNMKEEVILVIGNMGSDAGYTVLTPHGVRHVPSNNPMAREAFAALTKSYIQLQEIASREKAA